VTRFHFKLHPLPPSGNVTTYVITWPVNASKAITQAWQTWIPDMHPALSGKLTFHTNDVTAVGVYLADGPSSANTLQRLLQPLLQVSFPPSHMNLTTWRWIDAAFMLAGCDGVWACEHSGRAAWKGKSGYAMTPLRPQGIDTIHLWMFIRSWNQTTAYAGAMLDAYGGKIREVAINETAFPHRGALFQMQFLEYWFQGKDDPQQSAWWVTSFWHAMRPYLSPFAYVNYIDLDLPEWSHAYYAGNLRALVRTKQRYDPENAFDFAQSIPERMPVG